MTDTFFFVIQKPETRFTAMIEIKIPIEKIAADKAASKALIQECVESGKAPEDAFLDILKRRGLPSAQKKNPEPKKPAA
ncbi:hypothetical protein [Akkermansia massiliensis]|uniref:hypothetical protein n=2 Tax=Bacteria TaxID=2 RepID=UPI00209C435C|nr:hypothetical protein [Akkermansia massiliensis]